MKILNLGSMNIDNTYRVKSIVMPGETISSSEIMVNCGGKGLNQSIALKRAGMDVYHAGLVGKDGWILTEFLEKAGVHTEYIHTIQGRSGHTIIQVDDCGRNSIVLCGGTNLMFSEEEIDTVLDHLSSGDLILLQNEINNLPYAIAAAEKKSLKIILNLSPVDEKVKKLDLSGITLLFVNEIEGEQLTGEHEWEKILDVLKTRYPDLAVVLTLGTQGAVFQKKEERVFQKAQKVEAIDTTGAGDTFTGFFIREYFETGDSKKALEIATDASAIAVTQFGAAQAIPDREMVLRKSVVENERE